MQIDQIYNHATITEKIMNKLKTKTMTTIAIDHPRENDVLCGRGGGTNNHVGNIKYRHLVASIKVEYFQSRKKQKVEISKGIVAIVHQLEPPGRFLSKAVRGGWTEIDTKKAVAKTSQALREDAPRLRAAAALAKTKDNDKASSIDDNDDIPKSELNKVDPLRSCSPQETSKFATDSEYLVAAPHWVSSSDQFDSCIGDQDPYMYMNDILHLTPPIPRFDLFAGEDKQAGSTCV